MTRLISSITKPRTTSLDRSALGAFRLMPPIENSALRPSASNGGELLDHPDPAAAGAGRKPTSSTSTGSMKSSETAMPGPFQACPDQAFASEQAASDPTLIPSERAKHPTSRLEHWLCATR